MIGSRYVSAPIDHPISLSIELIILGFFFHNFTSTSWDRYICCISMLLYNIYSKSPWHILYLSFKLVGWNLCLKVFVYVSVPYELWMITYLCVHHLSVHTLFEVDLFRGNNVLYKYSNEMISLLILFKFMLTEITHKSSHPFFVAKSP